MTKLLARFSNASDSALAKLLVGFFAFSLIISGFICSPLDEIVSGLYRIITSSSVLISDYFVIGGMGAALVNSGLVLLISIGLTIAIRSVYSGATVSILFLMAGFALFGKNPLNIQPFFFGVALYAKMKKQPMARYTNAALFSTTLAPVVTQVALISPFPLPVRLLLGFLIGVVIGFIIVPVAEHSFNVHLGYTLFNYGFTGGMIALVIASVISSMGFSIKTQMIWHYGHGMNAVYLLLFMLLVTGAAGFYLCGFSCKPFLRLMRHSGRAPTDFFITDGIGPTLMNMSAVGLIMLMYIVLIGGDLNGPVIGAIFVGVGFAAYGLHPRNIFPVMGGVLICALIIVLPPVDPRIQLAALFSVGLAPIAGYFGWFWGVVAGFLHCAVVLAVGAPCGGFNLYNNGFASGLVALVLVSMVQGLSKKKS